MSYTHFTPVERGKIEIMLEQGLSRAAIARNLGRHRTSVMREIRRNSPQTVYNAQKAQMQYHKRRKASRPKGKLNYDCPLRDYVVEKIAV
jgi:IS30 family transposase